MVWKRFAPLLLAAALAGAAMAQAPPPEAQLKLPQMQFTEFKLANGLRVVLSVDHTLPVVTESMTFDVGAREEHKGRSGFAHLFEHLMFEGSAHAPKGTFEKLIEGYGGNFNANTHEDYTFYYTTVPSNVLETVMWLDADRMSALNVTAAALKNQISVVKEEKRLRVDNAPYGALVYSGIQEQAFSNWQNSHPVIGSFADLDAATLQDVMEFFHQYYAPDNCVLTIVGDFDAVKTKAMVEHYFGWIPDRSKITPVDTKEPEQTAPRRMTLPDPQAKLPAITMSWHGPERDSQDFYALNMLGELLFDGDSSRMYQALVKNNPLALEVEGGLGFPTGDYSDYRAPGMFSSLVIFKPNATDEEVEKLVMQQIHEVEANGVPAAEMQRLRTKFSSDWIQSEQTTLSRAQLLGLATMFDGSPEKANTELEKFLAVTPEEMAAVARKYLTSAKVNVIVDQPGAATPAAKAQGGGR
ncbi:MAG TPA: pitrilysin family protein [Terriglobales bacterium]|nr:pitrilysin family protein [Terriglobales bacterium]